MKNIVVSGIGIITGLGVGKHKTIDSLRNYSSGIGKIKHLNTIHSHLPVSEVDLSDQEMLRLLNITDNQPFTRTTLLGIIAAQEALSEANLLNKRPPRVAFINGTTVGGMEKTEELYLKFFKNNTDIEYISLHDCAASTDSIASFLGEFDFVTTISTACSSAANAVILGANLIKSGDFDIVIAGGTECLSKFHLNGFNSLMILDKEPCKPFDKDRSGLNLGEGAAYIVLESDSSAARRNVSPICKLSGYANCCDAFHQTAFSPDGEGAFLAMSQALKDGGILPSEIDYINAHGTGTTNNDLCEGIAIKRVFGEKPPAVSSTKSYTGHTTSAAGSVESVISILALQHNFIPANLNFKTEMDELGYCPIIHNDTTKKLRNVMNNSFGFGGNDSSCIFSKIDQL